MNEFLHGLLRGELEADPAHSTTNSHTHAIQEIRSVQYEKIKSVMGGDFAEEVWNAAGDELLLVSEQAFQNAFRLAGRFLLAMLA